MAEYKVLLTTSGLGSRLGNLTKFTNKSLVRIGDKPAISHIIESYPPDVEFVVTLGHYGSHVKQYLTIAHPERAIKFVEVDNYMGEGSSLLYSISHCEEELQCPFIFHACDTILGSNYTDNVDFTTNWSIGGVGDNSQAYRTINCVNGWIVSINEKGEQNFDYVYVGVSGIKDYQVFWRNCRNILNTVKTSDLSDCHIIRKMDNFRVFTTDEWYDMGNVDSLKKTRSILKGTINVLDKDNENIFIVNNNVIKFFENKKICSDRISRTQNLKHLVPPIVESSENFYKYKYVEGHLLADGINLEDFRHLLNWATDHLWKNKQDVSFKNNALSFYKDKTILRVDKFLDKYNLIDKTDDINGITVPPINSMLELVDFNKIMGSEPTGFHGDFILDNILLKDDEFTLIDWRQDFNGSIDAGDMRYDLAKLNHNLILNHQVLAEELYSINTSDTISCDVFVKKSFLDCKEVLRSFCEEYWGTDFKNIEILTAIIWINMSPLHEYPLDMFLYYFGKYNLFLSLNK